MNDNEFEPSGNGGHRETRRRPRKRSSTNWARSSSARRRHRGAADLPVQPRPLPAGRRAGPGQDLMISTLGRTLNLSFSRIQFTPDLMPADITGTDVIEENRTHRRPRVPLPRGAAVLQRDPGRRDQPHAAQDAGRLAGSHAGAAGDGGPGAARLGRSVLRAGHAEPHRAGRHLSAARGPAGPLHVQGLRQYPNFKEEFEIARRTTTTLERHGRAGADGGGDPRVAADRPRGAGRPTT